jgi:peptidyl-prolyl cis-trans isomerase D
VSDLEVTTEIAAGRAHVSLPAAFLESLGQNRQLGDDSVRLIPVKNPKTKKFDAKYAEKQIRYVSQMSPAEFRDYQRSEMIAARMRDLVKSRVRISEAEAFDRFAQERSTATLDYVRFDRRFYTDLLVDTSPTTVDAWVDAHKEEVDKAWESRKAQVLPECRSMSEIVAKLEEAPTDEEKAKAKAKVERARDRILKGEDFAAVARAMSEGVTASRGGEIGCMAKGIIPKPLEAASLALTAGKMSDVISAEAGFYLLKLDQIAKDADAEKLGRAQTGKELYLRYESERLAVEASKKVAAAVKGGKSLKDALDLYLSELKPVTAEKKKDKKADEKKKVEQKKSEDDRDPLTFQNHPARPILETTLPFNVANAPIPGVRESAELAKIAFGLEKPGDAPNDAIPADFGYVAIQLKEKTPAGKEAWDKVRDVYIAAMRGAKANDALALYVKRLSGQLASEAKFTAALVDDKIQKGGDDAPPPVDDDQGE